MQLRQLAAQARLDGIKSGIQRIRVAFVVTNVAAAAMFISGWNTHFSRTHDFLTWTGFSENPFVAAVQRENITQTLQGEVVTVALLGIRVRALDFAVLGSLGMLMCACWMFFGLRGYYTKVVVLLDDTRDEEDPEFRKWIAHGIDSILVFSALRSGEQSVGFRFAAWFKRAMWYLPALITGLVVCVDLYSAFALSAPPGSVSGVLKTERELDPWRFYLWEIAATLIGIVTLLACRKMANYDTRADGLLQEYYSQILTVPRTGQCRGDE